MHERIELINDDSVIVKDHHGCRPIEWKKGDLLVHPSWKCRVKCDGKMLDALQLALACYRQTGSFTALSDDSAVPFTGKRMRAKRSTGPAVECTIVECCDNGYFSVSVPNGGLFATTKDNLLPLKPQPTYRPYTPAEAVRFLGRTLRSTLDNIGKITSVAENGACVRIENHTIHPEPQQPLINWKTLCDNWVIHDTGEPCGIKEEA